MKTQSSWLATLQPCFLLIGAVWLVRLIADAVHLPRMLILAASVSAAVPLAIILSTVLLHSRRQATYGRIFLSSFLLSSVAQLLIIATLIASVLTGWQSIFSAPEFSMPNDPRHLGHIGGHLVAIPFGTLVGGGIGSIVLWVLRGIQPNTDR